MALSATTQWEVRNGGSDTVCGGAFDPGQTAGMFTDGAATVANTTAPSFGSASYSFIAGDVNAYVFIGAGTNWTKGWYKITAVDSGKAILSATAGAYQAYGDGSNTADGCASVASPTGATWSIDYSQQDAAQIAYTDLACAGAGLTVTSATSPFGKQQVGNSIVVTGGDANITAGVYVIASVSGVTATVIGAANISTGAVTTGTGNLGGAMATDARVGGFAVGSNHIWIKYHADPYLRTSTTSNVAGGRFTGSSSQVMSGYKDVRGEFVAYADRPTIKWGTNGGSNYLTTGAAFFTLEHVILDGDRGTYTGNGFSVITGNQFLFNVTCKSMATPIAQTGTASNTFVLVETTDCTALWDIGSTGGNSLYVCALHDNLTATPIRASSGDWSLDCCLIYNNAGVPGMQITSSQRGKITNSVIYGNGGHGIYFSSGMGKILLANNIIESNDGTGIYIASAVADSVGYIYHNSFCNNTNGPYTVGGIPQHRYVGNINTASSVFVDPANGDFRLNSGAGAALRNAGWPPAFPGLTWPVNRTIGASGIPGGSGGGGYFQPW